MCMIPIFPILHHKKTTNDKKKDIVQDKDTNSSSQDSPQNNDNADNVAVEPKKDEKDSDIDGLSDAQRSS